MPNIDVGDSLALITRTTHPPFITNLRLLVESNLVLTAVATNRQNNWDKRKILYNMTGTYRITSNF
jgi:hypothetical protein